MKKILITGSNGLLGQKLVKLLKTKSDVEIYALSKGANRLFNKPAQITGIFSHHSSKKWPILAEFDFRNEENG